MAKGLQDAIPKAADKTAKQFLEAQLRMLSKKNDVTYTAHTCSMAASISMETGAACTRGSISRL